jgi:hypothetical protein
MPKMIPPQGLKEVAIKTERGTKVYKAGRDGLINVENSKHAKQMKHEGLGEASLGSYAGVLGYYCSNCGFNSLFVKCGKCGKENPRVEGDGE